MNGRNSNYYVNGTDVRYSNMDIAVGLCPRSAYPIVKSISGEISHVDFNR